MENTAVKIMLTNFAFITLSFGGQNIRGGGLRYPRTKNCLNKTEEKKENNLGCFF